MATIVIVGNRDAALEAAMQLGHEVLLVSDRKVSKKRRATLRAVIEIDFSTANQRLFIRQCIAQVRAVDPSLIDRIRAVVATTERAVLPAAWLRTHLELAGNSTQCAYLCRNKLAMKRRLQTYGVGCTDFASITRQTTASGLIQRLGLPLVLKPVDSSGARGATIARQQCDVEAVLQPGMLAESFVHGIEMSVESFVRDGEIQFVNLTEYLVPLWSNIVPATVPEGMQTELLALNRKVITALGINRGMTHMEVFLTATAPIFSEIAIRPPGGCLMELIRHSYGFNAWHSFLRIELGEQVSFPERAVQSSGVVFLHPGPGRVKRLAGFSPNKQPAAVVEVSCDVSVGETLKQRKGSGESAAHVIATGKTRADIVVALTQARRGLTVELARRAEK